jgi:acyl-CoA reductase-like NAD-dependent aldehyde dehydrogenase
LDLLSAADGELQSFAEGIRFDEGAEIFEEGSPGDCFYIIDNGVVRIELAGRELDSDFVLGYVNPASILGEISLLDGMPRSASAIAHGGPVAARKITRAMVDRLIEANPALHSALMHALGRSAAERLRRSNERVAESLALRTDPEVDDMVARAKAAQAQIEAWSEEELDALLRALADEVDLRREELAIATVEETGMGDAAHKARKNRMASRGVYESLTGYRGHGKLHADPERLVTEFASPLGVVFGIVPMTNPVATAIFKTLIAVKSRNALILSFHSATRSTGNRFGDSIQHVLIENGAPTDLIQWVRKRNSRRKTELFMSHPDVSLVLATGGASVVQAAYASGTPAIGVGPGNAPALICSDASADSAAEAIITSKCFDNGLVCGSEHNLVVVQAKLEDFEAALIKRGAAILTPDESRAFLAAAIDPRTNHLRPKLVGKSAMTLAETTGIVRPYTISLLVVPADKPLADNPLALEKMAPVLSLFVVHDEEEGFRICKELLCLEGTGHTAIIHTQNRLRMESFAQLMPAGRTLVNSPGSQGVVGFTTNLDVSLTLGCGSYGKNSTTDNVTYRHLTNVKRMAEFVAPTRDW